MDISLFNYDLPPDAIAYYPARQRDLSRLMILDRVSGRISHDKFTGIVSYLNEGDALVVNDTKVLKARLFVHRQTGGKIELFLLNKISYENRDCWEILSHPTKRLKEGEEVVVDDGLMIEVIKKVPGGRSLISFRNKTEEKKIISKYGHIPLPIYIHRPDEKTDESRYQTIFAKESKTWAVAAPTAGLHFTPRVLKKITGKGIKVIPITLHVGYGTFKPVKVDNIEDHSVDAEYAEISKSAAASINRIRAAGGKIFAVGTTSVRTLESAPQINGEIQPFAAPVDLYIRPGYQFNVVDHLITNFHLPKSSLILLVSALAGREKILEAYKLAVKEKYRFYSYGDCMLIL
nr:tRNA preQ1(34) S-adenosylmethionine ribosyltransferase-isomerase QueA [candidate division Zixibacteria bacterium]